MTKSYFIAACGKKLFHSFKLQKAISQHVVQMKTFTLFRSEDITNFLITTTNEISNGNSAKHLKPYQHKTCAVTATRLQAWVKFTQHWPDKPRWTETELGTAGSAGRHSPGTGERWDWSD